MILESHFSDVETKAQGGGTVPRTKDTQRVGAGEGWERRSSSYRAAYPSLGRSPERENNFLQLRKRVKDTARTSIGLAHPSRGSLPWPSLAAPAPSTRSRKHQAAAGISGRCCGCQVGPFRTLRDPSHVDICHDFPSLQEVRTWVLSLFERTGRGEHREVSSWSRAERVAGKAGCFTHTILLLPQMASPAAPAYFQNQVSSFPVAPVTLTTSFQ